VASAKVVDTPKAGGWIVDVQLNPYESQLWDQVAAEYFHHQLAIDLNGVIVEAPLIQPANSSFSSFDGRMQLFAVTKSGAYDLAAALTSGPLAVPLVARG
jgi:preprotein translocase subunit SecD